MKKIMVILMTIVLCLGITACGGKQDPVNQATAAPTTASTTVTSTDNPLGFDPNHPEGWTVENCWDKWVDWMKSKDLPISEKDLSIGNFSTGMSLEDATKYFPPKPFSETKKNDSDYGDLTTKKITFDSLVLTFVQIDKGSPFDLSSIEITGKAYATSRGLRIGDSAEKLFTLYGIPSRVSNNEWVFTGEGGNYELFHAVVVNGIVKKIVTNNVM